MMLTRKAEWYNKLCKNEYVSWKDSNTDEHHLIVAAIQLFSNKSHSLFKASALSFYPLHMFVLHIIPETSKEYIKKNLTMLAYLPNYFEAYITHRQRSKPNSMHRKPCQVG